MVKHLTNRIYCFKYEFRFVWKWKGQSNDTITNVNGNINGAGGRSAEPKTKMLHLSVFFYIFFLFPFIFDSENSRVVFQMVAVAVLLLTNVHGGRMAGHYVWWQAFTKWDEKERDSLIDRSCRVECLVHYK